MLRPGFLVIVVLIAACGSKENKEQKKEPSPEAIAEAQTTFKNVCALCHGESGKGNGTAAVNLETKPRNYTDKAWQATVTDDQIKQIILGGGPSVGKSILMPAQPQLRDKPEVVEGLVRIIRAFGK